MEPPTHWIMRPTPRLSRDLHRLTRRHPREHAAILRNLQRYLTLLNCTQHTQLIQAGFLHSEPQGVVAIDERGGGGSLRALRLYTYADQTNRTLHLLSLGDKDSQSNDLRALPTLLKHLKIDTSQ
jgi:hypothetical protein